MLYIDRDQILVVNLQVLESLTWVKLAARSSSFLVLEPFLDTDLQGGGGVKTAARSSPFRT